MEEALLIIRIRLLSPGIEIKVILTLTVPNPPLMSALRKRILQDISFPTFGSPVPQQELTDLRFDIFRCAPFVLEDTGSDLIRDIE